MPLDRHLHLKLCTCQGSVDVSASAALLKISNSSQNKKIFIKTLNDMTASDLCARKVSNLATFEHSHECTF